MCSASGALRHGAQVMAVQPELPGQPGIEVMRFVGSGLTDFEPLGQLIALRHPSLYGSEKLRDLAPLASLRDLEWLDLRGCRQLADLRPLAGPRQLAYVGLIGSHGVTDLTPLGAILLRGAFVEVGPGLKPRRDALRNAEF